MIWQVIWMTVSELYLNVSASFDLIRNLSLFLAPHLAWLRGQHQSVIIWGYFVSECICDVCSESQSGCQCVRASELYNGCVHVETNKKLILHTESESQTSKKKT